jgi:mono/diheme cytochrome c family protein
MQRFFLPVGLLIAVLGGIWFVVWRQAPEAPAFVQTTTLENRTLTLEVSQFIQGQRTLTAWVRDPQGQPVVLDGVDLRFTMPFICSDEIKVNLEPVAEGRYQARGAFFGMTGGWIADITLRDAIARAERTRMVVPINELDMDTIFSSEQLTAAATIAAGQQLYAANCLSCHGTTGNGDGPLGVTLSPAPPDFAEHMVLGKHTDGQLFLTISNGSQGTAMRGYGEQLSAEEIWQLVGYIRTFAR